jgi:hypothetical protein
MRTLQLRESEAITYATKEENPLSKRLRKKTTTSQVNTPITSRKETEKILSDLKLKMALEEKQKDINQYIIQLTLFLSIGLFFVFFFVKNFY